MTSRRVAARPEDQTTAQLPIDPEATVGRPTFSAGVFAVIAIGGALGTLARYEVERTWPSTPRHFPLATFVINTSGAFLIGLLVTLIVVRAPTSRFLRPFSCIGVLGGWTTMSTVALEADRLFGASSIALAFGYLLATLIAGAIATVGGMALARVVLPNTKTPSAIS